MVSFAIIACNVTWPTRCPSRQPNAKKKIEYAKKKKDKAPNPLTDARAA
jgi:hypothetical protein